MPLPLTDREREIATLVAQGLSNSEIADALTLSVPVTAAHFSKNGSGTVTVTAPVSLAAGGVVAVNLGVLAVQNLLTDPLERQAMARCGRKLIDGRGPDRLVTALEVMLHRTRAVEYSTAA